MANYIHYTQEQKDRARTTDIVDLLEIYGISCIFSRGVPNNFLTKK